MKQNKYLLLFLFLLSIFGFSILNAQKLDCKKFRTGEFEYIDKDFPFKITRNSSYQIEIDKNNGSEIHALIEWKSDCEYILTYEKILDKKENFDDLIGKKIYVEIIKTDGNKFTVHAKSDVIDHDIEFIKIDSYN